MLIGPGMSEHPALAPALPVSFSVNWAVQLALAAPVSTNCNVDVLVSMIARLAGREA